MRSKLWTMVAFGKICVLAQGLSMVFSVSALGETKAVKGKAEAGKALYAPCIQCHGAKGEGKDANVPPALRGPKLAGKHEWYLIESIGKYKKGYRGADPKDTSGSIMKGMAGLLVDDQAIADVAAYIATIK